MRVRKSLEILLQRMITLACKTSSNAVKFLEILPPSNTQQTSNTHQPTPKNRVSGVSVVTHVMSRLSPLFIGGVRWCQCFYEKILL